MLENVITKSQMLKILKQLYLGKNIWENYFCENYLEKPLFVQMVQLQIYFFSIDTTFAFTI